MFMFIKITMDLTDKNKQVRAFLGFREYARKLAESQNDRLGFARALVSGIICAFRENVVPPVPILKHPLCAEIGKHAKQVDIETAAYQIGTIYTVTLPEEFRTRHGIYYTPPTLASRLLDIAESAGANWGTARIIDPACGGGCFLTPIALRMTKLLSNDSPEDILTHIEKHLFGFEIDPFGAWMSQVFVETAIDNVCKEAGRRLRDITYVRDSLDIDKEQSGQYDVVVGNPPYGRVRLSEETRKKWDRSLYGHANLYGLFADLAVSLASPQGIIAYVTPTSFLGGKYFKSLRGLLAEEAFPYAIDFITSREGVFTDVLQETLLSVYCKDAGRRKKVSVSFISVKETDTLVKVNGGKYSLPADPTKPWFLPRSPSHSEIVQCLQNMPCRFSDFGYTVSTGPLVWNRHKDKLHDTKIQGAVPLIWAECVDPAGNGKFMFKATARNHSFWYKPIRNDDPNIVRNPCILLQRTTSIEQSRRLIAAELPLEFLKEYDMKVTVENHLNMIQPINGSKPAVSMDTIVALLNSETVDLVFRCINGSTAVSAYELEAMPLPSLKQLVQLERIITQKSNKIKIEKAIKEMYFGVSARAAA